MISLLLSLCILKFDFDISKDSPYGRFGPHGFRKNSTIHAIFSFPENPELNETIVISMGFSSIFSEFLSCFYDLYDINKSTLSYQIITDQTTSNYLLFAYCSTYLNEKVHIHLDFPDCRSDYQQDWLIYSTVACLGSLIFSIPLIMWIRKHTKAHTLKYATPLIISAIQFIVFLILEVLAHFNVIYMDVDHQFISASVFYTLFIIFINYFMIEPYFNDFNIIIKVYFLGIYPIAVIASFLVCGMSNNVYVELFVFLATLIIICIINTIIAFKKFDKEKRKTVNELFSFALIPFIALILRVYSLVKDFLALRRTLFYQYIAFILYQIFTALISYFTAMAITLMNNYKDQQLLDDNPLISQDNATK